MLKKMISAVSAAVVALGLAVGTQSGAFGSQGTVSASAADAKTAQTTYILPVQRTSGSNRYTTAVECSKQAFPKGAKTVIIASGTGYADALAGASLASTANAPVLLSAPSGLTAETIKEIQRLKAKEVLILGGENAVPYTVEYQITGVEVKKPEEKQDNDDGEDKENKENTDNKDKQTDDQKSDDKQTDDKQTQDTKPAQTESAESKVSEGIDKNIVVKRIQGKNRYETSVAAAQENQLRLKKAPNRVFFVSGCDFPDALSIAPIAGLYNAPVIYVDKSGKLNEKVVEYLESTKGKIFQAQVIGGTSVIGDKIFEQIKPYIPKSTRLGESNRYLTNIKINQAFASVFKSKALYVATGKDYPDALTGSLLAKNEKAPLLLVSDTFTAKQKEYIKSRDTQKLCLLGGAATVTEGTVTSLFTFVEPQFTMLNFGTTASLTWQEVPSASAYELYRDGKLLKRFTDRKATSYTDSGLKANLDYNYKLRFVYKSKTGEVYNRDFTQSSGEYHAVLNSVTHSPRSTLVTENAQPAKSTFSSYNIMLLKTGDWATLDKFAKTHFTKDMTNADKVAYTLNWINKNVWYGTVQDGGWAILLSMVNKGTFSYVNCIFNHKIGQCNCYNGALVSMMLYLGYDAHLVMGHRGTANSRGAITSRWQHFWGEVSINGQTYVMEAGNYGEDGDWMHVCERYRNVDTPTHGYIKNNRIMMT